MAVSALCKSLICRFMYPADRVKTGVCFHDWVSVLLCVWSMCKCIFLSLLSLLRIVVDNNVNVSLLVILIANKNSGNN